MKKPQEQYAFWQYDQFPYLLWSRVVKLDEKNKKAEVIGYGGATFNYVKVLPKDEALKVIADLCALTSQHDLALQSVNRLSRTTLDKIAPWRKG